ncbi:PIG-L deacetylase family protein [Gallaecimonas xiamenensis]|uniref:PIG-L deacetylase family protein n=1 Tax=Gallaecimonas xiamenensis TaxID=1207039 RepID=UPI00054D79F9|nr:PIG-L family deacetylase [Gallaecimonas xiamenensis]
MKNVLVVAPHADDESLGCGGTLLRHRAEGDHIHWLIVTGMSEAYGYSPEQIAARKREIEKVADLYHFSSVTELGLPPAQLDALPLGQLIGAISPVINRIAPQWVYVPYRNDAHSDHQVVFDAVMSATKSFRYPFIKRLMTYETLSETDFGLKPEDGGFRPNIYVDISQHLDKKLDILDIFSSEMGEFPFPRSRKALSALAALRGVQSNAEAAEAFMLLKEINQ